MIERLALYLYAVLLGISLLIDQPAVLAVGP
jgi:hypothetical protein